MGSWKSELGYQCDDFESQQHLALGTSLEVGGPMRGANPAVHTMLYRFEHEYYAEHYTVC
jgi:hypothetical protein